MASASRRTRKRSGKSGVRSAKPDPRTALQPKLRMIANGSASVNVLRAEQISALTVPRGSVFKHQRGLDAVPAAPQRQKRRPKLTRRALATMVHANVFVDLKEGKTAPAAKSLVQTKQQRGRQIAGVVRVADLEALAGDPNVCHVQLADALNDPTPVRTSSAVQPPVRRKFGDPKLHKDGSGVLIGVIDVQGFDFAHLDFLDSHGRTRFVEIWDQGGTNRPAPAGYDYGSRITRVHMNRAIVASERVGAPATALEPQSQMEPGSHGTHVASIAAGNRGVCAKADIAAVLIAMAPDDDDPRKSFYDSTRIIDAIEYLTALAESLRRPLSINISLGTNGHAHDGSSPTCRWLDALLNTPGRSICVAAGNAGQERAESDDDLGYVIGRIHTAGRIAARGLTQDIGWTVIGNGRADISENELEVWYHPQDQFSIAVRTPDGVWTREISPGEYLENHPLPNGTVLSIYNERYHLYNGANYLAVYLSPPLNAGRPTAGVAAGLWTVRLRGLDVRDGSYHGWIERDDPRPIGVRLGDRELWNFPSFLDERTNVDNTSISSLACAHLVVGVGNLDELKDKVNITSSQGPTRDGRSKPDVCAPGTDIVAANGFAGAEDPWLGMTGTSMASPYVAGVIGLMLAANPRLTAAQVLGLLHRTAQPLTGTSYAWKDDAGYGAIMPSVAIAAAASVNEKREVSA